MNSLWLVLVGALLFIGGLLFGKRTGSTDAKVLDLTNKINSEKNDAALKETNADEKTKEYLDSLKAYDPNFHNDDGDGKPSA